MRITLHIGRHKTGSTSIQLFLTKNTKALLEKGILVPISGRPTTAPNGHHQLAWDIQETGTNTEAYYNLEQEISNFEGNDVIITSECFDQLTDSEIKTLRSFLSNHDVRIIVYLRNQIEAIESMYRTDVTHYEKDLTFWEFLQKTKARHNYRDFLMPWMEIFGRENINVQLYDKNFLVSSDIIEDFSRYFSENSFAHLPRPSSTTNHGIPSPCVSGMVLLRKAGAATEKVDRFRQWSYNNAKDHTNLFTFLSTDQAVRELEYYLETNEWLRQNFFPDVPKEKFLALKDTDRYYPVRDVGSLLAKFISDF